MATKTKAKKKAPAPASPYAAQIAAEDTLKFGPQKSTLMQATTQALANYQGDKKVNAATAKAVSAAADAARPAVEQAYSTAGAAQDVAHQDMATDLAGLGSDADRYRAAATREGGGAKTRLASQLASATQGLEDTKVRAAAGAAAGNLASRTEYKGSLGKISDQLQALGVQEGAFGQARAADLDATHKKNALTRRGQDKTLKASEDSSKRTAKNAKKGRDQQERNSKRSAGIDPDTGAPIPGGKLDPKAKSSVKPATPAQRAAIKDNVAAAIGTVKPLIDGMKAKGQTPTKESRAQLAQLYLTGRPARTKPVVDEKTGKQAVDPVTGKPQVKKIAATPKIKQLYLSIALDVAIDGHISKANAAELAKRGLTAQGIGLPTLPKGTKQNPVAPAKTVPFAGLGYALPGKG